MIYETMSEQREDKEINTIIEIRKDILVTLRKQSDNIDRIINNKSEQSIAKQEIKEIAEMVSEKDALMAELRQLNKVPKSAYNQTFSLIYSVRNEVISAIHKIESNIIATQYDEEELRIVFKELKEFELMIKEKDRIFAGQARGQVLKTATLDELNRINPHISRYFCIDENATR